MMLSWLGWASLLIVVLVALSVAGPVFFGAPWHWASTQRIREGLSWCDPKPGETLVDLGSGDGRALLTGAREFQLRGRGVEIDPLKVWISRWRCRRAGLQDQIRIVQGDARKAEVRDADIVFIYLTHQALDQLLPKLQAELKPTARILCYRFCFRGIQPVRASADHTLFLYRLNRGTQVEAYS